MGAYAPRIRTTRNRPRWLPSVLALALTCLGGRSDAAITSVADGYYQCSEAPGQFSREDIGRYSGGNALSGRIKVQAVGSDATWAASAGLFFEGKDNRTLGVAVSVNPDEPHWAYVQLIQLGEDRKQIAVAKVPADSWVQVKAEINGGTLRVSGGGNSKQLNIGQTQILVRALHCQSGDFDVDLRKSSEVRSSGATGLRAPRTHRPIHSRRPSRSAP